eukprot:1304391-Pleurochrysis_carterae.AAC.1
MLHSECARWLVVVEVRRDRAPTLARAMTRARLKNEPHPDFVSVRIECAPGQGQSLDGFNRTLLTYYLHFCTLDGCGRALPTYHLPFASCSSRAGHRQPWRCLQEAQRRRLLVGREHPGSARCAHRAARPVQARAQPGEG